MIALTTRKDTRGTMPFNELDRRAIHLKPLAERTNKVDITAERVLPEDEASPLSEPNAAAMEELIEKLQAAREKNAARMLVFGAHTIKNCLAPVLIDLIESGWITHLATNGAGIIHDWEFAFQGQSSEDVKANMVHGEFGTWDETGRYLNLALLVGAYRNMGYGESIGAMVENECLDIPSREELEKAITPKSPNAAAAADLLNALNDFEIDSGALNIPHPHKSFGLQAAAYRIGIPFTGHPMFGHDIHYTHPLNHGAAIGRTAERDFLRYADSVSNLQDGVYISLGSAVMSPMVFEKSLSMARNVARQRGEVIDNQQMAVVDLQKSHWDWTKGEPPEDNPDYYLRYNKTFSRMGGTLRYMSEDNRNFLLNLAQHLKG